MWAQKRGGEQTKGGRKGRTLLDLSDFLKDSILDVQVERWEREVRDLALSGQWNVVLEGKRAPAFVPTPWCIFLDLLEDRSSTGGRKYF